MTQTRSADLIAASRLPHTALRACETYLKWQMFRVEDGAVLREQALYRQAFVELRAHALALGDSYGLTSFSSSRVTSAWRDAFMAYVSTRLQTLLNDVTHETIRASAAALTGAYYGRLWLLDMATKDTVQIKTPLLRGSDILSTLTEDVYSDLIQSLLGKQWRQDYALEMDDLTLKIRRAIGTSAINGEGVPEMMNRVADSMGVAIDRRVGKLGSTERQSYRANFARVQTLTRTVINRMSNAGAISAYRANSDILSGYEWLTAEDERVCPICEELDGTTYSFHSNKQPPEHPNCRCTVIPVIKPDALENAGTHPRRSLKKWIGGFGMEKELADFLSPAA